MMADIGAVNSSAFIFGMASLHKKRFQAVAKFRSDLKIKNHHMRSDYILKAQSLLVGMVENKIKLSATAVQARMEQTTKNIVAKTDQTKMNIEYDVLDATWEMKVMERVSQFLSAPGGGSYVPDGPSQTQSKLAGMLGGAAVGGMLAAIPGVNIGVLAAMGIGAVLGALFG